MTGQPSLVDRMRVRALEGGFAAQRLREAADELELRLDPPEGEWDAKKLLGAWARARLLWRDVTGEPLV